MRTQRNATIAVGAATSTLVSESKCARAKRLVLELSNLNAAGGNDVFVSVGEEAVTNKGRRIQPGQTITWSADNGYMPPQDQINAIAAGATSLTCYEEIEV
jgi:hypothetical protein